MKRLIVCALLAFATPAWAQFAFVAPVDATSPSGGLTLGLMVVPDDGVPITSDYQIYGDSSSAWGPGSIPVPFERATVGKTLVADAATTGDTTVYSIDLDGLHQVCIGHEDAISTKPDWLSNNYIDSEFDSTGNGAGAYSLYCQETPVSGTVNFGGNCAAGGCTASNYFVSILPAWRKVPVTASEADTEAPTTPGSFTAEGFDESVVLNWTASTDNVGVDGYEIERTTGGGTCTPGTFANIATVGSADVEYSDTGLTNTTEYAYRMRAFDAAGNLSSYTSTACATPEDATVLTPPPVANWDFDNESLGAVADPSEYDEWKIHEDGNNTMEIRNADPLCTGCDQYQFVSITKDDDNNFRMNRTWMAPPLRFSTGTDHGGGDWSWPEYWYGLRIRLEGADDDVMWYPFSFHDAPGCCGISPPLGLQVSAGFGIRIKMQANDDNGGNDVFSDTLIAPEDMFGTTYTYIFRVKWDTRTGGSSTGEADLYIDSCDATVFEWDGQVGHPEPATDGQIPYPRLGMYKSLYRFGGADNGDTSSQSSDSWLAMDSDGSCAAMLQEMTP